MKKLFAFLKNRGFTLVEALVATIIAGYCILPIMGTLHMGIQKTQGFDHYEKLRLLARSRLNKELSVGAFDHTAIDTTTTYHYVYYNTDTEPKLLTIDTNIASGSTASAGTFLNIATVSSILYSYKVSVAIKENLQLGTSTQNIEPEYLKSVGGLKALTVTAELEFNDNVGTELEIDPSDPNSPPLPSISLFSILALPSHSDNYLWVSNAKNVEIIGVDPDSKTAVHNILLNCPKPGDRPHNDNKLYRPWNLAVHPNNKFLICQRKNSLYAVNTDVSDETNFAAEKVLESTITGYVKEDAAKKDEALKDLGVVFRPDGKYCFATVHSEKALYAWKIDNADNWGTLALSGKTLVASFTTGDYNTDQYSVLHAGNDGWLYVGLMDKTRALRFPMYAPSHSNLPFQEIASTSVDQLVSLATSPDGRDVYVLWNDASPRPSLSRYSSLSLEQTGNWQITFKGKPSSMALSNDGRYLGIVDEFDAKNAASNEGGLYVTDLRQTPVLFQTLDSTSPLDTTTNAPPLTAAKPFRAARAAIGASKKDREQNDVVIYNPWSKEFYFDDKKKPLLFSVDASGTMIGSFTGSIPDERIVEFAPANDSNMAMAVRKPHYILVGTDAKKVEQIDVRRRKIDENRVIENLRNIPQTIALSPDGENFKVGFNNLAPGQDTYETNSGAVEDGSWSADCRFVAFAPDKGASHIFATFETSSNNAYWMPGAPVAATTPASKDCRDIDFDPSWARKSMVTMNNGGFLMLFAHADGSSVLDWIGRRQWGTDKDKYERFARWASKKLPAISLPAAMPGGTTGNLDSAAGTITILRHEVFPINYRITNVKFTSTFSSANGGLSANAKYLTPVIVEINGSILTVKDIGTSILISSPTTAYDTPINWTNGGIIQANCFVGWWNGQGSTTNAGVVKWGVNASGKFVADYYPASTCSIGAGVSDSAGANRDYEIQFAAEPAHDQFPPLNSKSVAISADDRFLAIETYGSPNKIYLYDFAGNNFGHETQLEGWVTDYRVGNATYWAFGNPATNCFLSNSNPTTANGIKLMDAITSRDTWTSYKTYPANFYLASGDTVSGGNNTDKRNANRRHFGYFRPSYDAMQVAVANQDHSRLFVNHSFAGSRTNDGSEGSFACKISQASYTTSLFQIDYNTNAGDVKQGIFTHTNPAQSVGTIGSSGSGDSKFMTMDNSWTAIPQSAAPTPQTAQTVTMPFRFQPTFLTVYEPTGCINDSASAIVWSRDIADPILYFLDTIQDDVWVIKPGKPATRINYGSTNLDFTDNQLVISNDGQSLIAAREDNNTVMFFNISEPTSFNFPGGTIAESSLPSNFGKIDFIATMSAKPTVLAASPYNVFKSTAATGTYQQVATLSLNISGISNAALASGGIYILGGSPTLEGPSPGAVTTDGTPANNIFKFDPTYSYAPGSTISPEVATLPKAIHRHAVAAYDNELYVFNGKDTSGPTSWVQKYTPETGEVMSSFDPPTLTTTEYVVNQKMSADDRANGDPTPARLTSIGAMADTDSQRYKAFDHITATSGNYWSTNSNGNWIKYNTGANPVYVNKLYLDNTVSPNSNGVNSFLLEGSNDDSSWTNLVSDSQPINTLDHPVPLTNPGLYKFYRFTVSSNHGGTYRTIREIKLCNTDVRRISPLGAGTVDATNKKATFGTKVVSWSAHGGTDYGSKVFDGNVNDTDKWDTNTTSGFPHWIAVDLGAPDNIDIVRIHCEAADNGIKNFSFQYSTDGVSWSTLNIDGAAVNTNPDNTAWNTYHVANTNSYKYYRLVCNDSWTSEIEVWEIEFFSTVTAGGTATKPLMTKLSTDSRGEVSVYYNAACATPYGIIISGGRDSGGTSTATTLIYWPHGIESFTDSSNHSLGISKSLPNMLLAESNHSLVWHKGKLYRMGGYNSYGTTNRVAYFDFDTNSWSNVTSIANDTLLKRYNSPACSFGDEIFMFGGYNGATTNTVVAFNPTTNSARLVGTLPGAGFYAKSAVSCGSSIYLIGGASADGSGGTAAIWKFTP